jgi:hypothetical protein
MVRNFEDEDLPQPWLKRKKVAPPTTRETRNAAKASAGNEKEKEANGSELPAGSARGRRRAKPNMKDANSKKGAKKNQRNA